MRQPDLNIYELTLAYLFWGGMFGVGMFPNSALAGTIFTLGLIGVGCLIGYAVIATIFSFIAFLWEVSNEE